MATKKTTKKTTETEESNEFRVDLSINLDSNDPEFTTDVESNGKVRLRLIKAGMEIQRMMYFAFDDNKEVPFILKHMVGYGTNEMHVQSGCEIITVNRPYIILRFVFNDKYIVQCTTYIDGEAILVTEGCSLTTMLLIPNNFNEEFYNYIIKKFKGLDCLSRLRVKEAEVKLF